MGKKHSFQRQLRYQVQLGNERKRDKEEMMGKKPYFSAQDLDSKIETENKIAEYLAHCKNNCNELEYPLEQIERHEKLVKEFFDF